MSFAFIRNVWGTNSMQCLQQEEKVFAFSNKLRCLHGVILWLIGWQAYAKGSAWWRQGSSLRAADCTSCNGLNMRNTTANAFKLWIQCNELPWGPMEVRVRTESCLQASMFLITASSKCLWPSFSIDDSPYGIPDIFPYFIISNSAQSCRKSCNQCTTLKAAMQLRRVSDNA